MKTATIAATLAALANLVSATTVWAQDAEAASVAPEAQAATEALAPADATTSPPPESAAIDAAAPATAGEDATAPEAASIPVSELKPAPAPVAVTPTDPENNRIDEIVVTAQRRKEKAQEVPVSVTVFNEKQIANANMTNSADLATYTPSLSTNQRFGPENASFAIRGFVQDLRTTASVGTYFADVVSPRGQSSQTSGDGAGPGMLFDLESVQVLKGPQGTLFGRNTTGGAVLLVPNKPVDAVGGYAEVSVGDFNALREQVVVNYPVTDSFRLRLGIDNNQRDGYLNNITHIGADTLGNTNYTAARLSAVLDVTDTIENYTIVSYVDSNTYGYTSKLFACNSNPSTFFSIAIVLLTGPGCQSQLAAQKRNGQDGYYDLLSPIKTPITKIEELRVINTTTWDVSEEFTVKNIFSYAHLLTRNGSDIFGTQFTETAAGLDLSLNGLAALLGIAGLPPLPTLPSLPIADPRREFSVGVSMINPDEPVTSQSTIVEEIQLQGKSLEERLEWQAGAYYEHSTPDGFSGNNSAGFLSCELATIEGDPSQYNCFDPLGGVLGSVLVQQYKTEYLNQAIYSQATYNFTEKWSLTGGLRYTWDTTTGYGIKTRHTFIGNIPQAPKVAVSTPENKSKAPTGVVDISYKPNDAVMTYAKFTRGYRQGSVVLAADPGVDTFKQEKVNTYELGFKSQFGGVIPGRFNVAAFYNDFTNQQLQLGYISPTAGTTTAIVNAGKSRIAGVEVEAYFRMLDNITLNLSYSHLDTKLLEQEDQCPAVRAAGGGLAGFTCTPIADVGDELPFAADNSYVATLEYMLPMASEMGRLAVGATYAYTGKRRTAATSSTPYDMLDPFGLLNLNLTWGYILGQPLDMTLFATNVLDEEYDTYVSGTYNVLGFEARMIGPPRQIGARLRYSFGSER